MAAAYFASQRSAVRAVLSATPRAQFAAPMVRPGGISFEERELQRMTVKLREISSNAKYAPSEAGR